MRVSLPVLVAAFAADLVLRNGKIVTMDPTAQSLAVRAGKITAVGADRAASPGIGPHTKVIDLHGMLAIPGFIEGIPEDEILATDVVYTIVGGKIAFDRTAPSR